MGSAKAWKMPSASVRWNGTSTASQRPGTGRATLVRPAAQRSARGEPAMRSTTRRRRASSALTLTALRTARSAQSALRFQCSASDRIDAAASLVTFFCSITPDTPTGWAAPMFVPGAIALRGHASMMNVPADAARAPAGAV